MTKTQKLLDKLLSSPKDFTWQQLIRLLGSNGFELIKRGKTSGSRRSFIHPKTKIVLNLHEPHPEKTLKRYQITKVVETLRNIGVLD